jgi:hypothetical protein
LILSLKRRDIAAVQEIGRDGKRKLQYQNQNFARRISSYTPLKMLTDSHIALQIAARTGVIFLLVLVGIRLKPALSNYLPIIVT